ncbi:hypothetical protein BDN67DRAFT_992540 [Paxillus ammoniavirescens]|nr:hypothetical protein BDN67DRAFT_992540 [Paxillus ammoniavirescens]
MWIKPPFVWNGQPDLDLFDQWVYQVDTWCELNGLEDALAIKLMVNFISDLPSQFFMKHVAMRQQYCMKSKLYEAMFDYCFPPDFKMARQAKDMKLVQIFWDGIQMHLCIYLLEQGMKPDCFALKEMVEVASRKEEAVEMACKEKMGSNPFTNEYQCF